MTTLTQSVEEHQREGKSKILSSIPNEPDLLSVLFKDSATAFNGQKFATIPGKGQLNATISEKLFTLLEAQGIPTAFVRHGDTPQTLIYRKCRMIPLEIVVRNRAYGSLCKRFKLPEGQVLKRPLLEFFLKDDVAGDPQVTDEMIQLLGLLPPELCLQKLKELAYQVNEIFCRYFDALGIHCCDFKIEVGLDTHHRLCVTDELSPDNFRLRDGQTGEILDKDVFRLDLGDLVQTYQKLLERMGQASDSLRTNPEKSSPEKFSTGQSYRAEVRVESRANILSPESKAIGEALHVLGFNSVETIRSGKRFELTLKAPSMVDAARQLDAMSETLLANSVVEDFSWSLEYYSFYEKTPSSPLSAKEPMP